MDVGTVVFVILLAVLVGGASFAALNPRKFNELCGGRRKYILRARRIIRSFYVAQNQQNATEQQHYLLRELRRIGVLGKEEVRELYELIELLEKTAYVLTLRELRSACRLPGEALEMQVRRWYDTGKLPAWAAGSGYGPEVTDPATYFRNLVQLHSSAVGH